MVTVTIKQQVQGYHYDEKLQGEFETLESAEAFVNTFLDHFKDSSAEIHSIENGRKITIKYDSIDDNTIKEDE